MTNIRILAPPESTLYQYYEPPKCAGKPNAAAYGYNMLSSLGVHATHELALPSRPSQAAH
jgi:hypothetical protein